MSKYKVLWIDDEWESMDSFISVCALPVNDIEIIPFKYAVAGMQFFEEHINELCGVILDAKCLYENDNEVARLKGLSHCVKTIERLSSKRKVPYFVFTGQPDLKSDESFKDTYEKYYVKDEQDDELIEDIKTAANQLEDIQIASKYADIMDVFPESSSKLMEILKAIEHNVTNDTEIIVKVRKVLEDVMKYCYSHGISLQEFTGSNLGECSSFLGQDWMSKFIPSYIQETMRCCVRISNPAAHKQELDNDIVQNHAPYMIRSVVFQLLVIIRWCKSLPQTEEEILQLHLDVKDECNANCPQLPQSAIDSYEDKKVVIERDDNGNLHGGECLISHKLSNLVGKEVTLFKVTTNTSNKTKNIYPYFGQVKQ